MRVELFFAINRECYDIREKVIYMINKVQIICLSAMLGADEQRSEVYEGIQ